jgi:hypothetical protein
VAAGAPRIWSVTPGDVSFAYTKRNYQAFGSALDLDLPKAPCSSIFLYLFERVEIEELFGLLKKWMLAQIAGQNKDCDQLICVAPGFPEAVGKTLRGSAAQVDGADEATRFVT